MTGQEIVESMSAAINELGELLIELQRRSLEPGTLARTVDALQELRVALDALDEGIISGRLVGGFVVTQADRAEVQHLQRLLQSAIVQPEGLPCEQVDALGRHLLGVLGVPNVDDLLASEAAARLGLPHQSNGPHNDSPVESVAHAFVLSNLAILLGASFHRGSSGPGGWVILIRTPVWRTHGPVVPDLAGWRTDRFQFSSEGAIMPGPDWVCEVLSPLTERMDRGEKVKDYIAHRVRYGWWVDPLARRLEVFRLENDRWSVLDVFEGETKVRAVPFDALELDLSLVWEP